MKTTARKNLKVIKRKGMRNNKLKTGETGDKTKMITHQAITCGLTNKKNIHYKQASLRTGNTLPYFLELETVCIQFVPGFPMPNLE